MSFDPALGTTRDVVRSLIGDITTPEYFADATYDAVIAVEVSAYASAARMARMIAALLGRQVDQSVGQVRANLAQRFDHYMALADTLDAQKGTAGGNAPVPYFGGTVTAEKDALNADTTLVQPYFKTDMLGDPNAGDGEVEEDV
jgi:hypothetical protein